MPGRGKRRRRGREAAWRTAARTASGTGRWETVFETTDAAEFRDRLRELRTAGEPVDPGLLRIDTFCGRLVHGTVHRLSVFVPFGP
ncbi:hypothetical protein [uncultured Streptomyces sp.]|uniref:hypothetical protein n=1 Tax=uncultured Streptomyces sp. TaxID=174707 RepID=UPI00263882AE|nr:hypothetical protein [uncultured Streptomyces sp.]